MAVLGVAPRLTDHLSLGVLARALPRCQIEAVLAATGRHSRRQRALPAHVVVYYVVALALFMQMGYRDVLRHLLEGLRWLWGGNGDLPVPSKSALSQARARLGPEPLRDLFRQIARPLATPATRGAWCRQWRLVALDGTTLDAADTPANRDTYGLPHGARGRSAFPQLRLVTLAETGTHAVFGAAFGRFRSSERQLARPLAAAAHVRHAVPV